MLSEGITTLKLATSVRSPEIAKVYESLVETTEPFSVQLLNSKPAAAVAVTVTLVPAS